MKKEKHAYNCRFRSLSPLFYLWLNHVEARDENVTLSDNSNYQTFVPNFRQLLLLPLKKTLGVPDVEYMTTYPCCHWPPNFSPRFLNQGFKWILLVSLIFFYGECMQDLAAKFKSPQSRGKKLQFIKLRQIHPSHTL